jgi:hypothetical protein
MRPKRTSRGGPWHWRRAWERGLMPVLLIAMGCNSILGIDEHDLAASGGRSSHKGGAANQGGAPSEGGETADGGTVVATSSVGGTSADGGAATGTGGVVIVGGAPQGGVSGAAVGGITAVLGGANHGGAAAGSSPFAGSGNNGGAAQAGVGQGGVAAHAGAAAQAGVAAAGAGAGTAGAALAGAGVAGVAVAGNAGVGGATCTPACTPPLQCDDGQCVACLSTDLPRCEANNTPSICVEHHWALQTPCGGDKPACSNGICAAAKLTGGVVTVGTPVLRNTNVRLVEHGLEYTASMCAMVQSKMICVSGGIRP